MSLEKELEQLAQEWPELDPPTGHEKRFEKRLRKTKRSFKIYWNVAAVLFLLLGLGISEGISQSKTSPELEARTAFYTQTIQYRLMQLEKNTPEAHQESLADVKAQLEILHEDYLLLQTQWEEESSHPLLLKALINNLQQQLNLLQALENNLNAVEKNDYENIF